MVHVRAAQEEIQVRHAARHDEEHHDARDDEGDDEGEQRQPREPRRFGFGGIAGWYACLFAVGYHSTGHGSARARCVAMLEKGGLH